MRRSWDEDGAALDDEALDLVTRMLDYNPRRRLTAREALAHPFFDAVRARVELARRFARLSQSDAAVACAPQEPRRTIKLGGRTFYSPGGASHATCGALIMIPRAAQRLCMQHARDRRQSFSGTTVSIGRRRRILARACCMGGCSAAATCRPP